MVTVRVGLTCTAVTEAVSSCIVVQSRDALYNVCHADACRLMDARGELALLAVLRPEGAAGVLDLSACGFEALPSIVWDLPGRALALQELNLTNNRLRTLPDVSEHTGNSWATGS
jgi:hypothetical protein